MQRLRGGHSNRVWMGIVGLMMICLCCLVVPLWIPWNPEQTNFAYVDEPPNILHWLGTNQAGTDVLAATLSGGQTDFEFVGCVLMIILSLGFGVGGIAAFCGGYIDRILMRFCDYMLNFPVLLLVIVITSVLNRSNIGLLILVIGLTFWPPMARLVRSTFLNLRDREYILAAKMSGAGMWRIMYKHMLPNALGPLAVNIPLLAAKLFMAEAGLSLFGFGVRPPRPSWGNLIGSALDDMTFRYEPWIWLPSLVLITSTVFCMQIISEGLRVKWNIKG